MEMSDHLHVFATLHPRKEPCCPIDRRLDGLKPAYTLEKRKISYPSLESNPDFSDIQPVAYLLYHYFVTHSMLNKTIDDPVCFGLFMPSSGVFQHTSKSY
jgi:hypothetical protein